MSSASIMAMLCIDILQAESASCTVETAATIGTIGATITDTEEVGTVGGAAPGLYGERRLGYLCLYCRLTSPPCGGMAFPTIMRMTRTTFGMVQGQYEVVEPPAGIESGGSTRARLSNQLFVYPKSGQSSEQQSKDRYECHHWAVEQSGYDPTVAGGGVDPQKALEKRDDYFRAEASCLEGRGYTVR